MPSHDHCCVFGCSNRRDVRRDLSFHTFPSAPEVRRQWVQACKREEGEFFKINKYTVVCSQHFKENDFHPELPGLAGLATGKTHRRLKAGTVPSCFSFRPPVAERPSPSERRAVAASRMLELEPKAKKPRRGESDREFELRCALEAAETRVKELEHSVSVLTAETRSLKSQIFRFENIKHDGNQLSFLTGLSRDVWDVIWSYLQPSDGNVAVPACVAS